MSISIDRRLEHAACCLSMAVQVNAEFAAIRERVMDGLVRRLGGKDEVGRPGILQGVRDTDLHVLFHRRRTRKEREADPDAAQFEQIGDLPMDVINQTIDQCLLNEPRSIDALFQRITNGRDVLREMRPEHADLIRSFLARAIPEEINRMVAEAQERKAKEREAEQPKPDPVVEEMKQQPVPQEVKDMVRKELENPVHTGPQNPDDELAQWAFDNGYQIQRDKRGKGTAYKKSWLAKMQDARDRQAAEERDNEERRRQRELAKQ